MINNDTKTVYIPAGDGRELADRLLSGERSRELYRRAGQYSVSVYPWDYDALASALTVLDEDSAVLNNVELYNKKTGLPFEIEGGQGIFIEP